jgi:hypothetical protein
MKQMVGVIHELPLPSVLAIARYYSYYSVTSNFGGSARLTGAGLGRSPSLRGVPADAGASVGTLLSPSSNFLKGFLLPPSGGLPPPLRGGLTRKAATN